MLSTEKKEQSYGVLKDVAVINRLEPEEVAGALERFLERSGTASTDIDAVVIGKNDDRDFQEYYSQLTGEFSPGIPVIHYKHLSGEYNTASAFGFWLAIHILRNREVPEAVLLNGKTLSADSGPVGERPAFRGQAFHDQDFSDQGSHDQDSHVRDSRDRDSHAQDSPRPALRNILLYNQYRGG
ncbi:MAG: hypothetical protein LRY55_12490 [Leadbetterella sp.]|nr:hypothetical protein [Leadbetterella sp.]